jgi:hypothetical protein
MRLRISHCFGAAPCNGHIRRSAQLMVWLLPSDVQNLCRDTSVADVRHLAVNLYKKDNGFARVEMEDCLLETMMGSYILNVSPEAGCSTAVPCLWLVTHCCVQGHRPACQ